MELILTRSVRGGISNTKTLAAVILLSLPLLPAMAADSTQAAAVVKDACGPADVKFDVKSNEAQQAVQQPQAGKALVYVVEQYERPGNQYGKPTVRVGIDGSWVGANRSTSYVFFDVEPGDHHLCADWQQPPFGTDKVSLANLTAEPGQTYYFRALTTQATIGFSTLDLELVNSDEGRLLVAGSPLSDYRVRK